MKKILTLALVTAMLTATGMTAFAADVDQDTTPPTGTTSVTMSVAPSYTVTIPESVVLNEQTVSTPYNYTPAPRFLSRKAKPPPKGAALKKLRFYRLRSGVLSC